MACGYSEDRVSRGSKSASARVIDLKVDWESSDNQNFLNKIT